MRKKVFGGITKLKKKIDGANKELAAMVNKQAQSIGVNKENKEILINRKRCWEEKLKDLEVPTAKRPKIEQCDFESPVNWNISKMAIRNTSFKTHTFRSLYVYKKNEIKEDIERFLGELGGNKEVTPLYLCSDVLSRMMKMFESEKLKCSLIIGSYVTSGYVRYIENLCFDMDKLNLDMKNDYMLMSEATMGGVFIGFVHLLNKTEENINENLPQRPSDCNDLKVYTKQVDQLANVNIEIEFICLGAVPSLKRFEVSSKQWELTPDEENDIKMKVSQEVPKGTMEYSKNLIIEKLNFKNQKMQSLMANQGKGITHYVHTAQTLYQAFEDFTMKMNDKNSGIPVTLRWREFTPPVQKETTQFIDQ